MRLAPIVVAGDDEAEARVVLEGRLRVFGYPAAEAKAYATDAVRDDDALEDPHDFVLAGKMRGGTTFKVDVRVA